MSVIKQSLICVLIAAYLCACTSIPKHVSAPQDDHVRPEDRAAGVGMGGVAGAGAGAYLGVMSGAGVAAPMLLPIFIGAGVVIGGVVGGLDPHLLGIGGHPGGHNQGYNQKEYKVSHILVGTEDESKVIAIELKQGKDFGTIAKEKSIDSGSSQNGGELGWGYIDIYPKPFADAVLNLKKGEISDPVQTKSGWHIIKLEDTRGDYLSPGH